jgi:uncharacterized UBP type Zn finger protein
MGGGSSPQTQPAAGRSRDLSATPSQATNEAELTPAAKKTTQPPKKTTRIEISGGRQPEEERREEERVPAKKSTNASSPTTESTEIEYYTLPGLSSNHRKRVKAINDLTFVMGSRERTNQLINDLVPQNAQNPGLSVAEIRRRYPEFNEYAPTQQDAKRFAYEVYLLQSMQNKERSLDPDLIQVLNKTETNRKASWNAKTDAFGF